MITIRPFDKTQRHKDKISQGVKENWKKRHNEEILCKPCYDINPRRSFPGMASEEQNDFWEDIDSENMPLIPETRTVKLADALKVAKGSKRVRRCGHRDENFVRTHKHDMTSHQAGQIKRIYGSQS